MDVYVKLSYELRDDRDAWALCLNDLFRALKNMSDEELKTLNKMTVVAQSQEAAMFRRPV